MQMSGLYTALVTPFRNNQIDDTALHEHLNYQAQEGISGIVLLGSTAEALTLTFEEHKHILKCAIQTLPESLPLVVGISAGSTAFCLEKIMQLDCPRIHAFMLASPYYLKPTQEGLYQHFERLAKASPKPIVLYNHPGRTGVTLELATLQKLLALPSIIALKETRCEKNYLKELKAVVEKTKPSFKLLSGCDDQLELFLQSGFDGLISVFSNAFVSPLKEVIELFKKRHFDEALNRYHSLLPLIETCNYGSNPMGIKYLLSLLDRSMQECRLPLTSLLPDQKEQMNQILDHYLMDTSCVK